MTSVDPINANAWEIKSDIARLAVELCNCLDQIGQRLGQMNLKIDSLDQEATGSRKRLEKKMKELDERFKAIEQRLDKLEQAPKAS